MKLTYLGVCAVKTLVPGKRHRTVDRLVCNHCLEDPKKRKGHVVTPTARRHPHYASVEECYFCHEQALVLAFPEPKKE